ncbi:MAG: DUF502 domain-containing protein [Gammaproteobacteria bacterium]|nr:DUF502 domain-containing protein [Gammaproteobacteria bacterium]
MGALSKIFFTGLAALLPVVISLWVVWWLGTSFETFLGGLYKALFGEKLYIPGVGIALGILLTFAVGLATKAWLFQKIFAWWDGLFARIPLVKTVYNAVRDFLGFVSRDPGEQFNRVVMVEFDAPKARLIGFVTRDNFEAFPGLEQGDEVAVYFPFSYQIGGYTLFLPKERLQPLDMKMEEAMRFVITAGLTNPSGNASGSGDNKDKP